MIPWYSYVQEMLMLSLHRSLPDVEDGEGEKVKRGITL